MFKFFKFFAPLMNNHGAVDGDYQDGEQDGQNEDGNKDGQERLFAGKYKTSEDLEKGYQEQGKLYQNLQNDVHGLKQQLQSVNSQLQQRSPAQEDKQDDYSQVFDKDSLSAIEQISERVATKVANSRLTGYQQVNKFKQDLADGWDKAKKEYGDDFDFIVDGKENHDSELYKRADEILEKKYTRQMPNGDAVFTNADAHYLAVTEAYVQLTKEGKSNKPSETNKDKSGRVRNISGRGSAGGSAAGKLSREEYLKLDDAKKDAYDAAQVGTSEGG